ncbi:hypothetical protein [Zavarzinella formosa]|uniref:hypothetical protein n=1 Tax=Zavarzinella formosa TaxID=360055 RepID=UPI0002E2FE2D|nr:hypothetical protein [Zavarzinella formosa]
MKNDEYDDYDDQRGRRRPSQDDSTGLTTVDWLLCIFCSGIGCIVGIVRLIQGKPNAGMMIGVSLLFAIIWNVIRFALEAGMQGGR